MAINELAELGRTLLQFVSIVQALGNNYFQSDAAWIGFRSRVTLLQATHDGLEESLEKYGLTEGTSAPLAEAVKEAKKLLDEEVVELEKRQADIQAGICTTSCYSVRGTLFPASVETHIAVAEGAYMRISEYLTSQLQIDDALREIMRRQVFLPPFRSDDSYVPLHTTEEIIFSALEGAGPDPAVVLLCGGPGKGKSTLARQTILRYIDRNPTFSQVVTLECGPNANIAAKQTELLLKLGGDVSDSLQYQGDVAANQTESSRNLGGECSRQSNGADFKILKSLQARLRNPKMLILLDDIWEPELICSLLNLSGSGSGAKYLVTSRQEDICGRLNVENTTVVQIEDLSLEDARKVLASHVQFEDQNIPQRLQGLGDKLIADAEGNPLVLATLGASIKKKGQNSLAVWEEVSEQLIALLERGPLHNVHGVGYPRSFLAAMKISINALLDDQKQLLALMAMCRNPPNSLLKSPLQFLYSAAISRKPYKELDFLIQSNELKNRHLLTEKHGEFWSIHALTQQFVLEQMSNTVNHVATLLKETNFDAKTKASTSKNRDSVIHALISLYIDGKFNDTAVLQIGHPTDFYSSKEFDRAIELKRLSSQPIMHLLVMEPRQSNAWTEELSMCVDQVLVDFVCHDLLRDGDISKLLASSTAVVHMLTFLENVCLLGEQFWKKNSIQSTSGVPQCLLNILQVDSLSDTDYQAQRELWAQAEHEVHAEYQAQPKYRAPEKYKVQVDYQIPSQAASVLARLCLCSEDNIETIANHPGMLHQLVMSLSEVQNPDLQLNALTALAHIAAKHRDRTTVDNILNHSGLVDTLILLLEEGSNADLQWEAAAVLENLATKDVGRKAILAGWPRLLDGLDRALLKDDNPHLQEYAAGTVLNMATTDEKTTITNLLNQSGLVDKLVKSLRKNQNPGLQQNSAMALCRLASNSLGSTAFNKLVGWPGLLEGLAEMLVKASNPPVQAEVAGQLGKILWPAGHTSGAIGNKLFNYPGLVDKLVESLDEDLDADLQRAAAGLLASLAKTQSQQNVAIAQWPGLLERLVKSLTRDDNSLLQHNAAAAIGNIANTTEEITLEKLLHHSGLVNTLLQSLCADHNSRLQESSATVLLNLAVYRGRGSRTLDRLMNWPGLLDGLTECMVKAESPSLQEIIVDILSNIIGYAGQEHGNLTVGDRLFSCPGFVDKFLQLLDKGLDTSLQIGVMALLTNLATTDSRQRILAGWPGFLKMLAESLIRGDNPVFQKYAASTIYNMANASEEMILDRLLGHPVLVCNLVKSLCDNHNPGLQAYSASALFRLVVNRARSSTLEKLVGWPELLEGLAESFVKIRTPPLQVKVAEILGYIISQVSANETTTFDKLINYPGLVDKLVKLLDNDLDPSLQRVAAGLLRNLAQTDACQRTLAGWPHLLEGLAKSLMRGDNPFLQQYAAATFANIANTTDGTTLDKLFLYAGLLDKLIKSLWEAQNPDLQQISAITFHNLARERGGSSVLDKLMRLPGLLEGLAYVFVEAASPAVKKMVSQTLSNIIWYAAKAKENTTGERLFSCPGLVDKLVKLFDEDLDVGLQTGAASVLTNLAKMNTCQRRLVEWPGLLEGLAESFVRLDSPLLQQYAAEAIANIANSTEEVILVKLVNHSGFVDKLVKSLWDDQNCSIQQISAIALCSLATNLAGSSVLDQLVNWPGLLEGLAQLLVKAKSSFIQGDIAITIQNILLHPNYNKTGVNIFHFPGFVDKLIESFHVDSTEDSNAWLQRGATGILGYLSLTDSCTSTLAGWPGLLDVLAKAMAKDDNPRLQELTAATIANIAKTDEEITSDVLCNHPGLIDMLVKSLCKNQNPSLQSHSATALVSLARNRATRSLFSKVMDWCGLLEDLADFLLKSDDPCFQIAITTTISACTECANDDKIGYTLLGYPGFVDRLVKALYEDSNAGLQLGAVVVLKNLANMDTCNGALAGRPWLLEALARSISKGDNPLLQVFAAAAIANIASSTEQTTLDKLLNHSGLVDKLVKLLNEDSNSNLQLLSATALCGVASNLVKSTINCKLAGWPGLLEGLAESLLIAQNPSLLEKLVRTLDCIIASANDNTTGDKVSSHPGLVDKLARLTVDDRSADLQGMATSVLLQLAITDIRMGKLAGWPAFLERLAKSLIRDDNPRLQEATAANIATLATGKTFAEKLFSHSGLVDKLVKALHEDQKSGLQVHSAKALCGLATYHAGSTVRDKLAEWPGLLDGLQESLLKAQNPKLQEIAARVLLTLAFKVRTEIAHMIVSHPRLIDTLLNSFHENQNPSLQVAAAEALMNLTHDENSIRAKVANCPLLLETITASLLKGENADFEALVVGVLGNLAVTTETRILKKIAESPGLVDKLVMSLAEDQNSPLQVDAARVLLNLAGDKDNNNYDISGYPGLLERLTKALLEGENLELRATVTKALTHLMATKDKVTVDPAVDNGAGINTWGQLDKLTKALITDQSLELCSTNSLAGRQNQCS